MKKLSFCSIVVLAAMLSCSSPFGYKYNTGSFPDAPVNLVPFNTLDDDYNSTAPSLGSTIPFCHSTNHLSGRANFDIVYHLLDVSFSKITGALAVEENISTNLDVYISNADIKYALPKINTTADEFGPHLIATGRQGFNTKEFYSYNLYWFLYSSGISGNQDIYYLHNLDSEQYVKPKPVTFLNSASDDAYPSLYRDSSALYFCSDRDGNFDIYAAQLDVSKTFRQNLASATVPGITKNTVLSSAKDDKCPFVYKNVMIFASNRDGGFGGYDLYYAVFDNGVWSAPVNFGDKINTSADEYRPIALDERNGFTNDFMVFSSNRTGGMGGFDLYYVGIPRLGEH